MHARPEGEEVRSPYDIVLRLISVKTVLARPERKKLENRYGEKMQNQFEECIVQNDQNCLPDQREETSEAHMM